MNKLILFIAIILSIQPQLSYADYDSFTLNVPNSQGGYTAITIKKSGNGYTGPQGEYYSDFPKISQLQTVYGLRTTNSTVVANAQPINQITPEEKAAINLFFHGSKPAASLDSTNELISNSGSDVKFLSMGYGTRGDFYRYTNNLDQAVLDYNKAIEINPNYDLAYEGRGKTECLKGDDSQAIADFTKAIDVIPSEKDLGDIASVSIAVHYQSRGLVNYIEGNYSSAIEDFDKALQNMPDYIYCYYFRGRANDHLGKHDQAVFDYNTAIQEEGKIKGALGENEETFDLIFKLINSL